MRTLGTYKYRAIRHGEYTMVRGKQVPVFDTHEMRVEILGQSCRKYYVKYLGFHANGQKTGHVTWVTKIKVKLDEEVAPPIPKPFKGETWLPYKDN